MFKRFKWNISFVKTKSPSMRYRREYIACIASDQILTKLSKFCTKFIVLYSRSQYTHLVLLNLHCVSPKLGPKLHPCLKCTSPNIDSYRPEHKLLEITVMLFTFYTRDRPFGLWRVIIVSSSLNGRCKSLMSDKKSVSPSLE